MDIPQLKTDPKLPYHYIIGVTMNPLNDRFEPGKLQLKYFLHFTNDEVSRVRDAVLLSNDKLFKTTATEALQIHECESIVHAISSMKFAINANMGTLHHFSSDRPLTEEDFEMIVKLANTSEHGRKLLRDSRIRSH